MLIFEPNRSLGKWLEVIVAKKCFVVVSKIHTLKRKKKEVHHFILLNIIKVIKTWLTAQNFVSVNLTSSVNVEELICLHSSLDNPLIFNFVRRTLIYFWDISAVHIDQQFNLLLFQINGFIES